MKIHQDKSSFGTPRKIRGIKAYQGISSLEKIFCIATSPRPSPPFHGGEGGGYLDWDPPENNPENGIGAAQSRLNQDISRLKKMKNHDISGSKASGFAARFRAGISNSVAIGVV
jgi:hypothetical protein